MGDASSLGDAAHPLVVVVVWLVGVASPWGTHTLPRSLSDAQSYPSGQASGLQSEVHAPSPDFGSVQHRFDRQSPPAPHGSPNGARRGSGPPSSHGSCPANWYAPRMTSLNASTRV